MLRVKKRPDTADEPKRHVELELRTPKAPTPPPMGSEVQNAPVKKVVIVDKKEPVSEEKPKKRGGKKKSKKTN